MEDDISHSSKKKREKIYLIEQCERQRDSQDAKEKKRIRVFCLVC